MRSDPRRAWKVYERHGNSGKRFEEAGGAFPRLQFFALMWHEFGFEAFDAAFESMRAVPAAERPKNDMQERNLMLVHFSEATGRNLAPYFEAWGIEVLEESRAQVAHLAEWMPTAPAEVTLGP
jgi:hypothetical protein